MPDSSNGVAPTAPTPARGGIRPAAPVPAALQDAVEAARRIEQLTELLQASSDAVVALDAVGVITFWSRGAESLFGVRSEDAVGHDILRLLPHDMSQHLQDELTGALRAGRAWRDTTPFRRPDGQHVEIAYTVDAVTTAGGPSSFVVVARDVTEMRRASRDALFLSRMLGSTRDGILVIDADQRVRYWNTALEQLTGWSAEEALGQRTLDLIPSSLSREERMALGRNVAATGSHRYEMAITRKDGTVVDVEVVSTAHRDPDADVYTISIIRDVGERKHVMAELGRVINSRASVAASLGRLRAAETLEATAQALCTEIRSTLALDVVAVYAFIPAGDAVVATALAIAAPGPTPLSAGGVLPERRSAYLLERATRGPWVEEWHDQVDEYHQAWREAGFETGTYTPLRSGDEVVGLIIAGTGDDSIETVAALLPALLEYAAVASALLGPDLDRRRVRVELSETIERIIQTRAFTSVFQPVVELQSLRAVGYEALTRFADGTPPNLRFADAASAGLSGALERSTLAAAFEAAGPLPASAWLAVNCSPSVIADGVTLPRLLEEWGWLTVVEVTEHEEIGDYAAFRRAVGELGPRVRLAIDDAGAGFASLRHILELGPQFVKLDMGMVRNVDRDPARQALIAGMVHFASQTGCDLIAEGVETEAERRRLAALGVRFGQGYLLGRPAPPPELARSASGRGAGIGRRE